MVVVNKSVFFMKQTFKIQNYVEYYNNIVLRKRVAIGAGLVNFICNSKDSNQKEN
jgi:hypothetical protein